ncbi:MAG: hypothetical protein Tsb0013_22400 [Phycisphaerales bacterium]
MRTLIALLVACVLAGCAHDRGRLLIIGGALEPDNTPVYRALERTPGERLRIVVIPVASGVPEESGPGTAMDLHANLTSPTITVIDPRTAPMDDVVRAIDGADAVWFTGGDQSRITEHMRGTPAHDACFRLLRRGGTIAGTSAGAAMMGERMITGGSSEEALEFGVTYEYDGQGVGLADGMGFIEGVLVDQHFEQRDRAGRLRIAIHHEHVSYGLGVNENHAVLVDLRTRTMRPIGDHASVLIPLRREHLFDRGPRPEHLLRYVTE